MAHRYRLTPDEAHREGLERHCADARYVWNLALEQTNYWRPGRRLTPGLAERLRQLAEARRGSWLGQGSSSVPPQALRDFDRALENWWGGSHRRPRWRQAGLVEGFCVRDVTVVRLNRRWATIHVPKLGPVRFRLSRPLPEAFGMARITMDRAGRWHVSFTAPQPGLAANEAHRLRRLQRKLARQHKGSNRRARTRSSIGRLRAREADRRKNWIEQTTTELVRDYDLIAIEDLKVKDMVRSAKGTVDQPGTHVAQKRGLNRAISAQSWSEFRRRLEDKAATCGVTVVAVNPAFTSQRCSACGHTEERNRESQAVFLCRACGYHDKADVNAAKNILAAGLAVTARGGTPRQGPDETRTRPVAA